MKFGAGVKLGWVYNALIINALQNSDALNPCFKDRVKRRECSYVLENQ